jgi:hypothetical protein
MEKKQRREKKKKEKKFNLALALIIGEKKRRKGKFPFYIEQTNAEYLNFPVFGASRFGVSWFFFGKNKKRVGKNWRVFDGKNR